MKCSIRLACTAQIVLRDASESIHLHALLREFCSGLIYLAHELGMRVRDVIEGKHSVAEFKKKERAEGDQSPER